MKEKFGTFLFCMLFVCTFGAVGAGAWWVIGATVHDGMRAKEWVRVKADLQSYGQGNVSYRYVFGGKQYHGDRLGSNIIGGTDNIDSWHEDMDSYMHQAQAESKPISVWVNPDNPTESMVDREIRWKFLVFALVFGLAFGGVGLGALVFGLYSLIPAEWRQRRRRTSDAAKNVGVLWLFTFFWNAIAFPIGILAVPQMIADGQWLGLLIMIFPLVGLMLLWGSINATWGLIRRGGADLVLADDTPQLGKPLAGHIAFARGVTTGDNFRVRLEARKADDETQHTVWSKEVQARVADSGSGPRIAFRFDPPANLHDTVWRLEAIAPNRGADVRYGFDVALEGPEEEESAELTHAVTAMDDEPQPVALGPGFEHVERMLNGAGVKLSREQMAHFEGLTAEQRAQVAKMVTWAPKVKKIVIGVVVAIVAFQILGAVVAVFAD